MKSTPKAATKLKLLLLTLISVSLCGSVFSQVWIRTGAVWHYSFWQEASSIHGFLSVDYVGDQSVNGKLCQHLSGELYEMFQSGPTTMADDTVHFGDWYTYVSGDTVFYDDNGTFRVLYNFGAQTGDQWLVKVASSTLGCNDSSYVEVVATGIENIGGTTVSWIDVQDVTGNGFGIVGRVYERFGLVPGEELREFLFPGFRNCDPNTEIDGRFFTFRCYEDSELSYKPYGASCYSRLGMNDPSLLSPNVYPNPANGQLNIDWPSELPATFELFSLFGQRLWTGVSQNGIPTAVNVSGFAPGIYVLRTSVEGSPAADVLVSVEY